MAKLKGKSLCKLVGDKILKKDPGTYKKLVERPAFLCLKCGRAANQKKNLCDPTKL